MIVFPTVTDTFCLHVEVSPSHTPLRYFVLSQNLATFGLDDLVLQACTWHRITQAVNPCGNGRPEGQDCLVKISVNFINVSPWKSQISSFFEGLPCSVGLISSTVAPKWAVLTEPPYSTLCQSIIIFMCSTSTHFSKMQEVKSCQQLNFTPRTVLSMRLENFRYPWSKKGCPMVFFPCHN